MSAADGFTAVVALNEAAKEMHALAFQVRLSALDAQVRNARDSRQELAGFREVSLQMRRWSDDLSGHLEQLRAICAASVIEESRRCVLRRKQKLLAEAATRCSRGELGACVDAVEARLRRAVSERRRALADTLVALDHLAHLGMMAVVLSRAAKIEAASAGPEERGVLSQVAEEFSLHSEAALRLGKSLVPIITRTQREAA